MKTFKTFVSEAVQPRWEVHFKNKKHGTPRVSARNAAEAIRKAEVHAKKNHPNGGEPIHHKTTRL